MVKYMNNNKIKYLIFAAILLQSVSALYAVEIKFSPEIKSVLVYPDRALITRNGTVRIPAGKFELSFDAASPQLDPASLRAFSETPACIVQGVNSHIERQATAIDPKIRELERKVSSLEKERDELRLRGERAAQEIRAVEMYSVYLTKVLSEDSTRAREGSTAAKWQESLEFLSTRRAASRREIQQSEEGTARVNEKIQIATEDLNRLKTEETKSIRIVDITLLCSAVSEAKVGFSYMIPGASWAVSYGMYLVDGGQMLVEYYGNIRQKTGEDWKDVSLSLSTSTPSQGAERPSIQNIAVSAREVRTRERIGEREEQTKPEESAPTTTSTGGEEGTGEFTALDKSGSSLIFRVTQPVAIPSGDRSQRVTVARFESKVSELSYRILPRQSAAHLAAKVSNDRPFPLLAGSVDVFRQSGYTGRSSIQYTPPGSFFNVGFGADRTIRIRRTVEHFRDTAGVLTSDKLFRTTIRVELENLNQTQNPVTILERVPVSDTEDVKVSILSQSTGGRREDPEKSGIYRWDLNMQAGEKAIITLIYTVRVPSSYPGDIYGD